MKNINVYEDFIRTGKEISETNNRIADETYNLLTHLERSHKEIIQQAKENLAILKSHSERIISKMNRLYPANEED